MVFLYCTGAAAVCMHVQVFRILHPVSSKKVFKIFDVFIARCSTLLYHFAVRCTIRRCRTYITGTYIYLYVATPAAPCHVAGTAVGLYTAVSESTSDVAPPA